MKAVIILQRYVFKVPLLKVLKGGVLGPVQNPKYQASSTVSAPRGLLCDEAVPVVPPAPSDLSRLLGRDNWEGLDGDRWNLPLLEAAGLHQDDF